MYNNLPSELTTGRRFVCWQYQEREGKKTKVPISPRGGLAKVNDPETWEAFDEAVEYCERHDLNGIGIVLSKDLRDKLVGIDLDHCIDEAGGLTGQAKEIVTIMNSYTEITPSGRGLRIFVKGELPDGARRKGDVEIYDNLRYLTLTGNHFQGTLKTVEARQEELINTWSKYVCPPSAAPGIERKPIIGSDIVDKVDFVYGSDDELLRKAMNTTKGAIFSRLWGGDWRGAGYPSQSEADLALCSHLAFWTTNDGHRIDAYFRRSGLMRPKWDVIHVQGRTYGEETIRKTLEGKTGVYWENTKKGANPPQEEIPQWQEPLLFGDIDVPEIPCGLLPGFLGNFAQAVTDAVQTPTGLAVMYSLPVISTCLQKRFEVAPFQDEYVEPLNIWTVTGLEPGTRKTAVKGFFTKPLVDWEAEQAETMKPQIREVNHVRDLNLKRIEHLKTKASKLSDPADREACLKEIFDVEAQMPDPIAAPQIWCDDSTPERLQSLMGANGERMALLSDEGGIFEIMAGLYSSGRANLNVFLQSHAGAPVRVDRQGRAVTLHRPALTFGLTVQPDVIADLACGDKARFRGNGTLARFLYCMPRSTVGSRDVTRHIRIPEEIKERYHIGIWRLLAIPPVFDEQGNERARILTLTQNALQLWLIFSQAIEDRQGPDGDLYSIQDWSSKLPGAALRIAGLFHIVEHGEHVQAISENTIRRSLKLCDLLIPHAEAAFGLMGADEATSDAKTILRWIMSGQRESFTQRECLKRHEGRLKKVDRLKKALGVMIERHIISEAQSMETGHRPSIVYQVNPAIHNSKRSFKDKIDNIDKIPSKPHFVDFVDKVYGDEKENISENEDPGNDVFVSEDDELPDIKAAGGEKWSF